MVDVRDTCFEVPRYIVGFGRGSENVICFEGTSKAENSDSQHTLLEPEVRDRKNEEQVEHWSYLLL
jgi:hypothetical protein